MRSADLVAAYLQGKFLDGEVVYCRLPKGYEEYDEAGVAKCARVDKPIYGIQQSGRRLQRRVSDGRVSLPESARARGLGLAA